MLITNPTKITADWLTEKMKAQGNLQVGKVKRMFVKDTVSTKHSELYFINITYSDYHSLRTAPEQIVLKIPKPDKTATEKEVLFYGQVKSTMQEAGSNTNDLALLTCFDAYRDEETGASHLVLEAVSSKYQSHDNPPSPRHAEQVIDTFATIHGFWWEHETLADYGQLPDEAILASRLALYQEKFESIKQDTRAPLKPRQQAILQTISHAIPNQRRENLLAHKHITLTHQDTNHLNILYSHDDAKLVDWQKLGISTGTDDLAYWIAFHWSPSNRKSLEMPLLRRYHEKLVSLDVEDVSLEAIQADYRASIANRLGFMLTQWKPELYKDKLYWARLRNGLFAYDDLDCDELFN